MSKANKRPFKKNPSRVIQLTETKNRYSPLETEESPTENENTRTDSPNTKITAKQNAINTANQIIQKSSGNTEVIHWTKGSSQLPSYLVILWSRKLKAGKCQVVLIKLCGKTF